MRIPSWAVPLVLRLLSLTRLASAGGGNAAGDLRLGFGLGLVLNPTTDAGNFPTATLSEPNVNGLSLDLDLFVRVGDCEFKTAIMPLHLLGKKSWNVYNTDNVERVKCDEAAAAAREAAEEERMQELDAERRMQILRGEIPTPLPIADTEFNESSKHDREGRGYGRERKRRKKAGENDTDFEMRVAREDADRSSALAESSQLVLRKDSSAPLTDHKGHISLFPESVPKGKEKNAEAEAEAAKKKKEYEDQYTMRFSNAAGFKQDIGSKPWYSKGDTIALAGRAVELENEEVVGKDVWGNEDPRRKERQTQRLVSSDPLAMMKAGAAQARQVEKERKKWREEKERELVALEKEERRKKRKRRHDDEDDFDDFRLDDDERRESRRREHREKDRSRDRERDHRRREKEATRGSHREDDRHRDRHRYSYSHRHRHHDR